MLRWTSLLLLAACVLLLSACPQQGGGAAPGGLSPDPRRDRGEQPPLVEISTLLASPELAGKPLRLQGRILWREQVSSPYYLDGTWGYQALQYCPAGTLVFEDDSGALQFYLQGSATDPDYPALIESYIGVRVEITAVWPDLTGMASCAAVCVCDPKLLIATAEDIVALE